MYSTYGGKGQFADAKGKGKGKGGGKGGGKGDAKGGGKGKGVGKALSFNNLPWFCKKCKFGLCISCVLPYNPPGEDVGDGNFETHGDHG